MNLKNFLIRLIVALFGIPFIFITIYFGNPLFLLLITLIQILCLREFADLIRRKGLHPSVSPGVAGLLLVNGLIHFGAAEWILGGLCLVFVLFLLIELFKGEPEALANVGASVLGFVYIGLLSFLILIRNLLGGDMFTDRDNAFLVMMIFATIWICDTAAYLFGANFGKHKLFERVSPNKTWEGAIAGLVFAVLFSILFSALLIPSLPASIALWLGLIIGILGQTSDLVESLFKRDAHLKDTSSMIPGHGGVLDRFDSPILIAPAAYALLFYWIFSA